MQIHNIPQRYNWSETFTASLENIEAFCNNKGWQNVYNPERLIIIEPCKTVTGRVTSVHTAPDGDVHLRIAPDEASRVKLNFYNNTVCFGKLVAEIVCAKERKNPKTTCLGYNNSIEVPKKGDRVSITGSYVLDTNHGWREIHPISEMLFLGR